MSVTAVSLTEIVDGVDYTDVIACNHDAQAIAATDAARRQHEVFYAYLSCGNPDLTGRDALDILASELSMLLANPEAVDEHLDEAVRTALIAVTELVRRNLDIDEMSPFVRSIASYYSDAVLAEQIGTCVHILADRAGESSLHRDMLLTLLVEGARRV